MACLRSSHAHATDTHFRTETRHSCARNDLRTRTCLRSLQGSESDVRLRRLLGWGEGCSHRRNGIGGCFGRDRRGRWWSRGRRGRRRGWCSRRWEWRRRCRGGRPGCGSLRERWCGRGGRDWGCGVIRYTRHTVFFVVMALSAAARAQTPPPAAAAPDPGAAAPAPATPGAPGPAAAPDVPAPAAAPAPTASDTARLDEIEQTARIALRKHELLEEEAAKRAKEAPKVTIDDKGFGAGAPGQVVRAEDPRPAADRRALLLRRPSLQANNTFLIRRFRPSLDGTLFSLVDFRMVPEFAGTVTILDALYRRSSLGMAACPRRQDEGPGRPRTTAERRRPRAARARARSELSSQRDVGVVLWGDVAGGVFQYIAGAYQRRPRQQRRRRGHQLREGLRRAAVLPSLPNRGAARLRQPRRRAGGADRQPQGPHSPSAVPPRPASRRTGPPVRTRSSSTWHRRPTRPARRRC